MFARVKKSGGYEYLQVVHNERINGKVKQNVIATLGRLDALRDSGQLDDLLASCARFTEHTAALTAARRHQIEPASTTRIGGPLIFERLWQEIGLPKIIAQLSRGRRFQFNLERAVFLTVLHRLFGSGSDRAAERWRHGYAINGVQELDLHHLYRTMAWLGEPLQVESREQISGLPEGTTKDLIEEELFHRRRNLFSHLELVFFDTTSIYFEGAGGESIGQHGFSKDHRPDCRQMVVGVVLDDRGTPICCEMWPGNVSDATTLVPVVDRLRNRFQITKVCVVADRGMISKQTITELEKRSIHYILGARMRNEKEIITRVVSARGPFEIVHGPRRLSRDPSPLMVKDVQLEGRRYVVCFNSEQAAKDRADRQAIVKQLRTQLKHGAKSLVGNKGYRKYLKPCGAGFEIDQDRVTRDAKFDGKWVLRTDTTLPAAEVALKYKELLMVESMFRSVKSILETRPIYHQCDDTIRGHVFSSFLAMVLLKELYRRLEQHGVKPEWDQLRDDLDALQEVTLNVNDKRFVVRTETRGEVGKAFQAVGVALGPVVRNVDQ